jgi:hypothetical protein
MYTVRSDEDPPLAWRQILFISSVMFVISLVLWRGMHEAISDPLWQQATAWQQQANRLIPLVTIGAESILILITLRGRWRGWSTRLLQRLLGLLVITVLVAPIGYLEWKASVLSPLRPASSLNPATRWRNLTQRTNVHDDHQHLAYDTRMKRMSWTLLLLEHLGGHIRAKDRHPLQPRIKRRKPLDDQGILLILDRLGDLLPLFRGNIDGVHVGCRRRSRHTFGKGLGWLHLGHHRNHRWGETPLPLN